jgi:hypothetical protein
MTGQSGDGAEWAERITRLEEELRGVTLRLDNSERAHLRVRKARAGVLIATVLLLAGGGGPTRESGRPIGRGWSEQRCPGLDQRKSGQRQRGLGGLRDEWATGDLLGHQRGRHAEPGDL